jgi:S-DNA-T family DNA segregation ATPase FtsK/SpoIIIE
VCGPPLLAAACARGLVLQLASALSPASHRLVMTGGWDANWPGFLPHEVVAAADAATAPAPGAGFVEASGRPAMVAEFRRLDAVGHGGTGGGAGRSGGDEAAMVALALTVDALPRECRFVLRIQDASAAQLLPHPQGIVNATIVPELVSREQARAFASFLSEAAEAAGLARGTEGLPESVAFGTLYPETELAGDPRVDALDTRRDSLACTPAWGRAGPVTLDLVGDGPHAIVGGTTGSGKSEFLVSWVLAMAAQFGPDAVTFLLVDFKGGASFAAVQHLPHSVGLITDLDDRSARRALTSLRAELRFRERSLADAGVRSIEQLPARHPLPRLVIVVDEFAAMVQDFPELHELFADVAARGRSLGVHLILCTQRPAGVVRDAVLANCTLRISLRVNNRADSTAVIGSAAAAELPRRPLGRALLCLSGGEPQAVQVALAQPGDSDRVARRWASPDSAGPDSGGQEVLREPRRPWCDPLPGLVRLDELEPSCDGLVFGLADLPQEQRQVAAAYLPGSQGSLLVIGGHRSGKSGVLAALAAADRDGLVELVPSDQEGAWDAVAGRLATIRGGDASPRVMLLDDIDALLGSYPEEYAHAFTELMAALLREGGHAGTELVLTACRLGSSLQSIAALCDSRLLLRLPNKQEHALAGGEPTEFDSELQPGAGHWRGNRVQVGIPAAPSIVARFADTSPQPQWDRWPGWAIVTVRPADTVTLLAAGRGNDNSVLPDGWEVVELGARSSPTAGELVVGPPAHGRVIVADAETWQSHWGLIGELKTTMPILFDGCSTTEFRAVSTLRRLPPPISPSSGAVWMLAPDGAISRVLPPWKASRSDTDPTSD